MKYVVSALVLLPVFYWVLVAGTQELHGHLLVLVCGHRVHTGEGKRGVGMSTNMEEIPQTHLFPRKGTREEKGTRPPGPAGVQVQVSGARWLCHL